MSCIALFVHELIVALSHKTAPHHTHSLTFRAGRKPSTPLFSIAFLVEGW